MGHRRQKKGIPMLKLAIFLAILISSASSAQTRVVTLKPSSETGHSADRVHAISPYIYGFGTYLREDRAREKVFELRPTLYRFGGNTSTRYNYLTNSWNSAQDWYFLNSSGGTENLVDRFMAQNRQKGIASAITLPMMGWVAKDGSSFSFPRDQFPKQEAFDKDAGNGVVDGQKLKADPHRTSLAITPDFVFQYVRKLKTQFGKHPHFYIMDNEPMLWNQTHRDVQHVPMSYDSYLKKYIDYATAVRKADPEAVIIGPALWGWMAMQNSAWDIEGPWSGGKQGTDRAAKGGQPFLEWFLEQIAKEEQKQKVSLLDIIDVHYYPEKGAWPKAPESASSFRSQLLRSTRSLWDKSYQDESWINEKIYLIPRLKALAARFKPSARVSIGEYNFRSERDAAGAIAQADILGIMAGEDLYAAQYWDFPLKDGTHRNAFLLYRNFDGNGAQFGDTWLPNSLGNQEDHSVYTAEDQGSKRVTVVMINKSLKRTQTFDVRLTRFGVPKKARLVGFRATDKDGVMERFEHPVVDIKKLKIETRPLSMQILELNY